MRFQYVALAAAVLVAGCGGKHESGTAAGVKVPEQFKGTWASDCTSPFAIFADGAVTLFPVTTPYPLKDATVQGSDFLVSYTSPDVRGVVTEAYAIEGNTLRLTTTSVDGKQVATWNKRPMRKCPG